MWKLTQQIPNFTYWKSVFRDTFCYLQNLLLDTSKLFYEDMVQTLLNHWEWVLGTMVCPGKFFDFFKVCFTNRILQNQAKSENGSTWFQMNVWCTIWKYIYSAIIWVKLFFKIQKSYFAYLWTNGLQISYSVGWIPVNKLETEMFAQVGLFMK